MSDIDTMNGRGYLLVLSLQIFVIDHENLERWIGSHRRNGPLSECPLSASAIFSLLSSRGGGGGNREVIVKNPSQSKSNRQLPLTLNWWLTVGFDFVFMWNKKENKKNVHPQKNRNYQLLHYVGSWNFLCELNIAQLEEIGNENW